MQIVEAEATSAEALEHQVALCAGDLRAARQAATRGGADALSAALLRTSPVTTTVRVCSAGFSLGIAVDLTDLAKKLPNSEQCVDGRKCVVVRGLKPPKWTASVRAEGQVTFHTTYAGEAARTAAKRFARLVQQRYTASAGFKKYRILLLQVLARLPFQVDLLSLAEGLREGERHFLLLKQSSSEIVIEFSDAPKTPIRVSKKGELQALKCKEYESAETALRAAAALTRQHVKWW